MTVAIVLIGPMGAGKTSIGRRVAKALGVPFSDTDAAVVREHGTIEDLFDTHGEAHFRELERQAVAAGLAGGGVVSLGGGAVLHPETRSALGAHRVVLLTVAPENVESRIRGSRRPLLQDEDPIARWHEIYAARKPVYEELADITFDTSGGPLQEVVDAIVQWAREQQADAAEPTDEDETGAPE
ncbi:MAG: shikimate kinase [Microbacterium sp. SCN 70-200]|uniref:shikimate kinase n=1 Tax=unclassified Microbacterium TaxID=2609290 RepID=UPI000869A448|nr:MULTISPECIES: shikimate kinase [unclassified Microbacterium]MBN9214274.1 AAA family ATPase [Microbacterium sp.]ODT40923.1 MAG: shikimate kinase [Microbacterium sp. SCN 70-200]OJV83907.1 MAG: shikimate kinase [Microbacterium sp. 70-16]